MELYIPYIISTGSIMIGGMGYSYFYGDKHHKGDNNLDNDYDIINEKEDIQEDIQEDIHVTIQGSPNSKLLQIIHICNKYCDHNLSIYKNNKKTRKRLFRYINEYNKIGHDNFIKIHKKYKND